MPAPASASPAPGPDAESGPHQRPIPTRSAAAIPAICAPSRKSQNQRSTSNTHAFDPRGTTPARPIPRSLAAGRPCHRGSGAPGAPADDEDRGRSRLGTPDGKQSSRGVNRRQSGAGSQTPCRAGNARAPRRAKR